LISFTFGIVLIGSIGLMWEIALSGGQRHVLHWQGR